MTQEEIKKKALEIYPREGGSCITAFGKFEIDHNAPKREGYIKALTEIESLPKIKGWVARFKNGHLWLFSKKPQRICIHFDRWYWGNGDAEKQLPNDMFPDLKWEDEPIEVELLIRKV